jgi:hypothetical protein
LKLVKIKLKTINLAINFFINLKTKKNCVAGAAASGDAQLCTAKTNQILERNSSKFREINNDLTSPVDLILLPITEAHCRSWGEQELTRIAAKITKNSLRLY